MIIPAIGLTLFTLGVALYFIAFSEEKHRGRASMIRFYVGAATSMVVGCTLLSGTLQNGLPPAVFFSILSYILARTEPSHP